MDTRDYNFDELMSEMNHEDGSYGQRLRLHLVFHFMNPIDKWQVRRKFPWKLALQAIKLIFIIGQIFMFTVLRNSHVNFREDTRVVMRHTFLKDWESDSDSVEYPSNSERYAVYDRKGIFEHMAFVVSAYYSIESESLAPFLYDTGTALVHKTPFEKIPHMELCLERIASVQAHDSTYEFDLTPVRGERIFNFHDNSIANCFTLNFTKQEVDAINEDATNIVKPLQARGISFHKADLIRLIKASINLRLRTLHISTITFEQRPECHVVKVEVAFENSRHTGQVHISIASEMLHNSLCNGKVLKGSFIEYGAVTIGFVDAVVLVISLSSATLCLRALKRAHMLKKRTIEYFEGSLKLPLSAADCLEFFNIWYVIIVVSDACNVVETIAKLSFQFKHFDFFLGTVTTIGWGIGFLLGFASVVLRIFGFFPRYNILILTVKHALPTIIRFLAVAGCLYFGFAFTGWAVLAPYSFKFRTLAISSETLFSFSNGDDIIGTFFSINDSNTPIKVFGIVFTYLSAFLFILILAILIVILEHAYAEVKHSVLDPYERSFLTEFMASLIKPFPLTSDESREAFSPRNLLNLSRGWQRLSNQEESNN